MDRSIRQIARKLQDDWAREGRQRAFRPLVILAVVWALGMVVLLRLDLAVFDFLGHAKDLSLIHGAIPDTPKSFVTPQGSTIDALSIQDLHDEDTSMLHGARNHLMVVLGVTLVVPVGVAVLLARRPSPRPGLRRMRAK